MEDSEDSEEEDEEEGEEDGEEEGEDDGKSGGESEAGKSSIPDATLAIMEAMEVSKKLAEKIRRARTLVSRIAARKYKVTLVVCPSQAIPVWKAECQTFFPSMLTLRVFYGSPQTGPHAGRSMVLRSTAIGLLEYLEGLPDEPSTLQHVVLTSYGTWVKRTTFWTGDPSIHKRQDFRDKVGQATGMDLDPLYSSGPPFRSSLLLRSRRSRTSSRRSHRQSPDLIRQSCDLIRKSIRESPDLIQAGFRLLVSTSYF